MSIVNPYQLIDNKTGTEINLTARCTLCLGTRHAKVCDEERACPECHGHGSVITANGVALLQFLTDDKIRRYTTLHRAGANIER
jgi:DnaJ-class molecular chaperone